jgi:N-acetylmuramoyl-L-alanine amidase
MMVKWRPSPNFTPGRGGYKPDVIVIHVMEGTLAGTDSWFTSEASNVSAHYGIGINRAVHQYVQETDQAWHAGRVDRPSAAVVKQRSGVNPNRYTIGIEHEGTASSVWPDTMYEDSARLVASIAAKWDIPIDRAHIVGHREIYAAKTCPGAGDVDRIVRMARSFARAPQRVLRLGSIGPDVSAIQIQLGAPDTGIFDAITDAWVRGFQRGKGLDVDGIVGENTRNALG